MKRTFSVAVALVLMLSAPVAALAGSGIAPYASDYLSSYNITVVAMGNGVVRISASVHGTYPHLTKIGFPTIVLYEQNGTSWKAVKTVVSQYNYDAGSCGYQFDYQGKAGTKFYASSGFYAGDSTGSDSRTADSAVITAS